MSAPRMDERVGRATPPNAAPGRGHSAVDGSNGDASDRGGSMAWGLVLIGAGVVWLVSLVGVRIAWELVWPIALVAIGALLLFGRRWFSEGALVGLGVVVTVLALATSLTTSALPFSAGDRNIAASDVSQLEPAYGLGAGTMTLDLRNLVLPEGTTDLSASVGMGELVVRVPDGVRVVGDGRVGMGEIAAFDRASDGVGPTLTFASGSSAQVLELDLQVGLGSIEVTR